MTPRLTVGPIRVETREEVLDDPDDLLPSPNSLRRAGEDSKAGVLVAAEVLGAWPEERRGRLGAYVGMQRGSLLYCQAFLDDTAREGPRMASPLLFSESVANNVATHLSLTLGLTGVVGTFIGARTAGIEALLAAKEDVETGATDGALVVVQGFPTPLTGEAYQAIYRTRPLTPFRGSAAFLLQRTPEKGASLIHAGVRCAGRSRPKQVSAVRGLWEEFRAGFGDPVRIHVSTFSPAGMAAVDVVREALGKDAPEASPPEKESFALDPFLRLFGDEAPGAKAVVCLSEEGTAGIVALA